jgi:hypothetical protein
MLKKDSLPHARDFFGWVSYTYTQSEKRENVPLNIDPSGAGEDWYRSPYEQEHAFKLVAGYKLNKHLFSAQFQFYTSHPYTRIIGSYEDTAYREQTAAAGEEKQRHVPVYDTVRNTEHNTPEHQLDLRYTYNSQFGWGNVKWYFELVDVYGPLNNTYSYTWYYNEGYSSKNPKNVKDEGISIIPNLGVEISF